MEQSINNNKNTKQTKINTINKKITKDNYKNVKIKTRTKKKYEQKLIIKIQSL